MKQEQPSCTEYIENDIWYDTHKWVETFNNKKIQSLKCNVCGVRSTAKFSEDFNDKEQYGDNN